MSDRKPRIVFMGTPEFAVASLKALGEAGIGIAAVVTAPDKPAGRGKQLKQSAIKEFAQDALDCPILQPEKLKDPTFLKELEQFRADIFVVVAFRMLPVEVWNMPPRGTINLHASLLPRYRGAAPINRAIMNGETQTGVSTFLINETIDTGSILLQETVEIAPDDTAGSLHDILMETGAQLIVKTVVNHYNGTLEPLDQQAFNIPESDLTKAPKIFKEDCLINWNSSSREIHNFIRGLSPYPCAFTMLNISGEETQVKIFMAKLLDEPSTDRPGKISSDMKTFVHVHTTDTKIGIEELQVQGKKKMKVKDFLQGNRHDLNVMSFY